MDVTLEPFKTKFPVDEVTAFVVHSSSPETSENYTVVEECPSCKTSHVYKFVNEPIEQVVDEENDEIINKYHCKCASCDKYFVANIEFCY